jgi:hypothetical protein
MKQGLLKIEYGKPIQIETEIDLSTNKQEPSFSKAIGTALKEYQKNIQRLLNGKYANQKELVLPYLQKPCNIFVFICNDGVFVRYDAVNDDEGKVRTAVIEKDLCEIAPMFSDFVLHFPKDSATYSPEHRGPSLIFEHFNADQTEVKNLFEFRYEVLASTEFPDGYEIASPPTDQFLLLDYQVK